MLVVEDRVERGETGVFVDPAITGDEVGVEEFVVVGGGLASDQHLGVAGDGIIVSSLAGTGGGGVGDVEQEGLAGELCCTCSAWHTQVQGCSCCAAAVVINGSQGGADVELHLGHAVGTWDEATEFIGDDLRRIPHPFVGELDAEHLGRLELDLAPVGQATVGAAQQFASGDGNAAHQCVFAQEHLEGGARPVGLVHVDPGGRAVDRVGRGTGHHHEVGAGRRTGVVEGVARQQGDVDLAVATFGDVV